MGKHEDQKGRIGTGEQRDGRYKNEISLFVNTPVCEKFLMPSIPNLPSSIKVYDLKSEIQPNAPPL
jgi:hypothetical protein